MSILWSMTDDEYVKTPFSARFLDLGLKYDSNVFVPWVHYTVHKPNASTA